MADSCVTLTKFNDLLAAPIVEQFDASDSAKALLRHEIAAVAFLNSILQANLLQDAIKFLAFGLPKRESVWWGYLSARDAKIEACATLVTQTLEATKQWVYAPNEVNRRTTQVMADKLGFNYPASWVAMAAFWSGGSITAEDAPCVIAPSHLTSTAVAGAILLAGAIKKPVKVDDYYNFYIKQGIDIANNGNGLI